MKRDSVVIYRDLFEGLKSVPERSYKRVMNAVLAYAMDGIEPKLTGLEHALFLQTKGKIDANNLKYENGKQGGRPRNQTETKDKPKDNQEETETKPNDNQTETKSNLNVKCKMLNDKCNMLDLKESKKESKDNNKKTNCTHVRESYEEIMDDLGTSDIVKRKIYSFVQHCQLNGKILTNDKLEGLLLQFDYKGLNDEERIEKIDNAIRGGYFDVRC